MARARFPDLTAYDYWRMLLRKLPRGILWLQQAVLSGAAYGDGLPVPLTSFGKFLFGIADELARIHGRANDLVAEAFPMETSELLDDWEEVAGLPEFGYPPVPPGTDDERRETLRGKLALAPGGQSCAWWEFVATQYGVASVDVTDGPHVLEFTVDLGTDCTRATCTSDCDAALVEFTSDGTRAARVIDHYHPAGTRIFWEGP